MSLHYIPAYQASDGLVFLYRQSDYRSTLPALLLAAHGPVPLSAYWLIVPLVHRLNDLQHLQNASAIRNGVHLHPNEADPAYRLSKSVKSGFMRRDFLQSAKPHLYQYMSQKKPDAKKTSRGAFIYGVILPPIGHDRTPNRRIKSPEQLSLL